MASCSTTTLAVPAAQSVPVAPPATALPPGATTTTPSVRFDAVAVTAPDELPKVPMRIPDGSAVVVNDPAGGQVSIRRSGGQLCIDTTVERANFPTGGSGGICQTWTSNVPWRVMYGAAIGRDAPAKAMVAILPAAAKRVVVVTSTGRPLGTASRLPASAALPGVAVFRSYLTTWVHDAGAWLVVTNEDGSTYRFAQRVR